MTRFSLARPSVETWISTPSGILTSETTPDSTSLSIPTGLLTSCWRNHVHRQQSRSDDCLSKNLPRLSSKKNLRFSFSRPTFLMCFRQKLKMSRLMKYGMRLTDFITFKIGIYRPIPYGKYLQEREAGFSNIKK